MAVRMTTIGAALLLACLPAAASVQAPAQPAVSLQPAAAPTYQGKPVSLHFQNIEVRALLQVIADFTGLNVVTSDAVTGQVSVRLRDVPWDQALDIVLQMRGLAMQRRGNVIWVAPRSELAERERQQLETSSAMQGLEPLRTQVFALNYARAADVVRHLAGSGQPAATRMLSTRGSAFAEARTNQLFVTDVPGVLQQVQELLAQLDIPVRQVMIEARIVEAGDSWGRSLGARLALVGQGHGGGMRTGVGDHRIGLASRAGQAETALYKLPAAGLNGFDAATLGLSLFSPAAARFLTLEISALEADGKGQLISSPRVVTADQSKALIEQGTELPYQVATASGATSLAFRKANLKLEVIPRITPEGQVLLDLDVNKDSVGRATTNGHAVDTKHVQTHVLVEDGGTVVIGGIFELNEREDVTKVPVLGDIPVVGELFRQRTQTREKREMLVFITPRILDGRNAAKAPATQGGDRVIILVGMPGSGKSSAGRQVARRLGVPFVDTDQHIEQELGMSIREYFAQHGEAAFRDLETATLRRLLQSGTAGVLSTGGGSVLRPENRALLREGGTVLYLRASPDEIYRRLRHDTKRPLLQVEDPRARLQELYEQRDALYRETAHYVVDTGRNTVHSLVNHIVMQLEVAGLMPRGNASQ